MAPLRLRAVEEPDLPRLTWLVVHREGRNEVELLHGPWVELGPDFAVEGVWAGPFDQGAFHRSPSFFGSGVRVEEDRLWVVPSRSPVDRVLYAEADRTLVASNSLPLLLGALGARLDPDANYRVPTEAPLKGIDRYTEEIPVDHPRLDHVRQRLYDPLVRRDGELSRGPRPEVPRFTDYADYVGTLREELEGLVENARSVDRSRPARVMSTISSGYDAPTVTALAADHGLDGTFGGTAPLHSLLGWLGETLAPDDTGADVARHLHVAAEVPGVCRELSPAIEPFFYATGAVTSELALAPLCTRIAGGDRPVVLLTGYHGDLVWDADLEEEYRKPELPTGGCDLSEVRQVAGFVNAPVPALHARGVADVLRISRSPEMARWRLGTEYDRPVPRRILEDAGVPREAFGQEKRVVERRQRWPRAPELGRDFADHLRRRHGWPTALGRALAWSHGLLRSLAARLASWAELVGAEVSAARVRRALGYVDLQHELHVWAVNRLADRLGRRPSRPGGEGSVVRPPSPPSPRGAAGDGARAGSERGGGEPEDAG